MPVITPQVTMGDQVRLRRVAMGLSHKKEHLALYARPRLMLVGPSQATKTDLVTHHERSITKCQS